MPKKSDTDHLNTPRLVADSTATTVWRWDQAEPFGTNAANEDPDNNSVAFDLPLRLPGQYLDKETGLHQNYFRDYDTGIGRYVQSDPIGIVAGLNTYAYVANDPLFRDDPSGLQAQNLGKRLFPPFVGPPGYRFSGSACGASGNQKNFPSNFGFGNLNQACVNHDACWAQCGANRRVCDIELARDIVNSGWGGISNPGQTLIAVGFYVAVSVTQESDDAFRRAQAEACKSGVCK